MFEVFDYRNGRVVCRTRLLWLAKLLTAPAWHGPRFTRRLWARTGMLDYGKPEQGESVPENVCPGCKRPYTNGECLKCDGDGNPVDWTPFLGKE